MRQKWCPCTGQFAEYDGLFEQDLASGKKKISQERERNYAKSRAAGAAFWPYRGFRSGIWKKCPKRVIRYQISVIMYLVIGEELDKKV